MFVFISHLTVPESDRSELERVLRHRLQSDEFAAADACLVAAVEALRSEGVR